MAAGEGTGEMSDDLVERLRGLGFLKQSAVDEAADRIEALTHDLAERDKAHECDAQIAADMISDLIERASTAEQALEQARKALVSIRVIAALSGKTMVVGGSYEALLAERLSEIAAIVKGETNG